MYAQEQPCENGLNVDPSSPTKHKKQRRDRRPLAQLNPARRPAGTALPLSETGQRLAALFPNGWDWIHSTPVTDRQKPEWETIRRYPLTPIELWSLHQDPEHIIGVRPSTTNRWGIIDLDRHSQYHPIQNPNALQTIHNALEDIGITRTLINQSSHSGGLHLYIPLPEAVNSYNLSITLKYHLEAAGIQIRSGQCEIFPNPKRYIPKGKGFSHYNGIRLPFQPHTGFIPLDKDLTPLCWTLETWLDAFDNAAAHQDITQLNRQIEDAKQNRRIRSHRDPHSIATWQDRIEQEKIQGWTGPGQTNEKLKAIACEARVFMGMDSVQQIAQYIQQTAQSTPGFHEHSNHTHDITRRSQEIATWAMRYYWPLGTPATRSTEYHTPLEPVADFSYHQAKREAAQHRIKEAIAQLQSKGPLAATATERANEIIALAKVGKKTLYRPINKPLWHPAYIPTPELAIETPTEPITPELPQPPNPPTVKTAETHTEQESFQPEAKIEKMPTLQWLKPLLNKTCFQLFIYVGWFIPYLLIEAAVALPPLKGQGPTIAAILTFNPLERGVQGGETALDPEENSFLRGFGPLNQILLEPFQTKLAQHERQNRIDSDNPQTSPPHPSSNLLAPIEPFASSVQNAEGRFARIEHVPEPPLIEGPFLRGFGPLKQSLPESFQAKLTQYERQRELDRQREQNRIARLRARQMGKTPTVQNSSKNLHLPQPPFLWPTPPILSAQSEPQQRSPRSDETSEFETWYVLAERFKLVSDFHWTDGEYWVEQKDKWYPYAELAGTFPLRYIEKYLNDRAQPKQPEPPTS